MPIKPSLGTAAGEREAGRNIECGVCIVDESCSKGVLMVTMMRRCEDIKVIALFYSIIYLADEV